jgi:hypothetical protein
MTAYPIVTKTQPTFYFVGVTTGKSSINQVFPLWMAVMGRPDVVLEGIDHPSTTTRKHTGPPWPKSSRTPTRWARW